MPAQPLMCQAELSPVAGEPRFCKGAQIQSSEDPCFRKEMTSPALHPTQLGTKALCDASQLCREPNPSQTYMAKPATSSFMPGLLHPGLKALLLPFYVMGRHQKQPNDCSCSHRELFGAPENVEKSSTSSDSSRVTHATSSLQYCSKPVHSQVYLTGSYTKPSNDHSHWHRELFLIPKNVGKSSTSPASSRINRETSRLQYSSNLVHSPVYMTGSCHEQPNDHSCLRREPFGVPKNVEKSSTSTESSRVSCETSSLRYSSKLAHSPVYATGSFTNRSNNSSCQHREPLMIAKNVEKTSTVSTSSHINCETSSSQNRSMLVQSPVYVTGNCAKQSNNNSCSRREPF
ncbi:uncharacterized protein EI90DRAFT_3019703 [Cantharellus anzutake]|uniref:uncharacterized protein n=1 Tax=Cantharellus anzutake TaxID=1750568 RepID=UPI001904A4C4|nr:uncharacterized protein EI90DRAFT_3019703 [Cantharellus anzutake]KAF8324363.1 hypothetical protein EI90DRAFT_3019703 [Cantharellus anzutake]